MKKVNVSPLVTPLDLASCSVLPLALSLQSNIASHAGSCIVFTLAIRFTFVPKLCQVAPLLTSY